jgi:signal transduction histidine kinase
MRRRVGRVALAAIVVSLVLLAVPFAIGIRYTYFADERTELERAALAAGVRVGPDFAAGDAVELPAPMTDGQVAVYDRALRVRAGAGPSAADDLTRSALAGQVMQGQVGGELVVAVPVAASEQVIGVVRASSPVRGIWSRILLTWLGVGGVAVLALLVGIAVAARQAKRLSAPLESLADVARSVASGDLSARAETSGIPEIDAVAGAQNTMVERLSAVLDHERHFASDAAHQLRTPLAGLQLALETSQRETPHPAIEEALHRTTDLQHTVEQVLALSRMATPTGPGGSLGDLFAAAQQRWHGLLASDGRRIEFTTEPSVDDRSIPTACQQIVDILLDNARAHGHGVVQVSARDAFGAVAIDVSDEGTLAADPADLFQRGTSSGTNGLGIGLSLARELAESSGGRLVLAATAPTVFSLLIPGSTSPDHPCPERENEQLDTIPSVQFRE